MRVRALAAKLRASCLAVGWWQRLGITGVQFLPLHIKYAAMSPTVKVTARWFTAGLGFGWGQELNLIPNFSTESYDVACTCRCEPGHSAKRHTQEKLTSKVSVSHSGLHKRDHPKAVEAKLIGQEHKS